MPLIKPNIQAALREAGLASSHEDTITERLDRSGLSLDAALEELSEIARSSENESTRLRAIETSLKLRGILKEQQAPPPSISIVIQGGNEVAGENPILLPRQLTNKLQ